jgi:acetoin utilization deacetylase AcuC-like enzyme
MVKKTGWVWDESFNWHNTGNGSGFFPPGGVIQPYEAFDSPESKGRFASLVQVSGYDRILEPLPRYSASDEEILSVHTPEYLEKLLELDPTGGESGESAYFGPQGLHIARLAAGGAIQAARAVVSGKVDNAYALIRPAGHHAEAHRGRGFCVLANAAIAAKTVRKEFGVDRIAFVDWDVHQGNGTESAFWSDPSTLTISLHQDRLYPVDRGSRSDNGGPGAEGTSLNIPLPAGTGDGGYVHAVDEVVLPALQRFKPDVIFIGSGMDAAATDPLGRMVVTSEGFRTISRKLVDAADELCGGKIVFIQEGGYSGHYVPFCGMAVLEELTGQSSGVEDPYMLFFANYPQLDLEPWQEKEIAEAAKLVSQVPNHS